MRFPRRMRRIRRRQGRGVSASPDQGYDRGMGTFTYLDFWMRTSPARTFESWGSFRFIPALAGGWAYRAPRSPYARPPLVMSFTINMLTRIRPTLKTHSFHNVHCPPRLGRSTLVGLRDVVSPPIPAHAGVRAPNFKARQAPGSARCPFSRGAMGLVLPVAASHFQRAATSSRSRPVSAELGIGGRVAPSINEWPGTVGWRKSECLRE